MGDRFMLGIFVTYFFYAVITVIQISLDKHNNQKFREILIFAIMLVISGILTYVHLAMNVGATSLIKWAHGRIS